MTKGITTMVEEKHSK